MPPGSLVEILTPALVRWLEGESNKSSEDDKNDGESSDNLLEYSFSVHTTDLPKNWSKGSGFVPSLCLSVTVPQPPSPWPRGGDSW